MCCHKRSYTATGFTIATPTFTSLGLGLYSVSLESQAGPADPTLWEVYTLKGWEIRAQLPDGRPTQIANRKSTITCPCPY